ncbi:hypothetical protein L6164_035934 [Bauhinia variegata]|uniref:Uncharacterized protein n=1 Tax=Bauhinia variegata TaxID=167791 RepID=A0ACB9KFJ6_BAUVA|nr:hypothetical protein L6164_035934 [Bauhinia variegata]
MKSSKTFFLLAVLTALAITLSGGESFPIDHNEASETENARVSASEPISLLGRSRFLAQVTDRVKLSCQRNPKICHVEGSAGPDCCKNKCVNLLTDALNCGKCGKKCGFKKICCEGKCVNPLNNNLHCGKCGNKCNKGSSCVYGMCNYA